MSLYVQVVMNVAMTNMLLSVLLCRVRLCAMWKLCEIYEECNAVEIGKPFEYRSLCGAGVEWLYDAEVFDEMFEIVAVMKW